MIVTSTHDEVRIHWVDADRHHLPARNRVIRCDPVNQDKGKAKARCCVGYSHEGHPSMTIRCEESAHVHKVCDR